MSESKSRTRAPGRGACTNLTLDMAQQIGKRLDMSHDAGRDR